MNNITNPPAQKRAGPQSTSTTNIGGTIGSHRVLVGEAPLVRHNTTSTHRSRIFLPSRNDNLTSPNLGTHVTSLGKTYPPRMRIGPQPFTKTTSTITKITAPHTKEKTLHPTIEKKTVTTTNTRSTTTTLTTSLPALPDQNMMDLDKSAAAHSMVESIAVLNAPTSSPAGTAAKMVSLQSISALLTSVVCATIASNSVLPSPLMASTKRSEHPVDVIQDILDPPTLLSTAGKKTTALSTTISTHSITRNTSSILEKIRNDSEKAFPLSTASKKIMALSEVVSAPETPVTQLTSRIKQLAHILTETKDIPGKNALLSAARKTATTLSDVVTTSTRADAPIDPLKSSAQRLAHILTETEDIPGKNALLAAAKATTTALEKVVTVLVETSKQEAKPTWVGNTARLIALFEQGLARNDLSSKEEPTPPNNTAEKKTPSPTNISPFRVREENKPAPSSPSISDEINPAPTGIPQDILEGYTIQRSTQYGVRIAYSSLAEEKKVLNTLEAMSRSPGGLALLQQIKESSLILVSTQSLLEKERLSENDLKRDGSILHQVFPQSTFQEENTHVFVLDCDLVHTQTSLQSLLRLLTEELSRINQGDTTIPLFLPAQRTRTLQKEIYLLEAALSKTGQSTQHLSPIKGLLTDIKLQWLQYETATREPGASTAVTITTLERWLDMVEQQAQDILSQQTATTNAAVLELKRALTQFR